MGSWSLRTAEEQRAIDFRTHSVLGGVFNPGECRKIIEQVREGVDRVPSELAQSQQGEIANDSTIRRGHVHWLHAEDERWRWIFERCTAAVNQVNHFDYQFELDYILPLQFTCYDNLGDHYGWHMDTGENMAVSYRKLSFSIQLSHTNSYDGGDLELMIGPEPTQLPRDQGTFVAFPSMITHRVRPITRGERYSLVGWISGPKFR